MGRYLKFLIETNGNLGHGNILELGVANPLNDDLQTSFTKWLEKISDKKAIELLYEASREQRDGKKWAYKVEKWKDVYFDADKITINKYIRQEHGGNKIEWIMPIQKFQDAIMESDKGDDQPLDESRKDYVDKTTKTVHDIVRSVLDKHDEIKIKKDNFTGLNANWDEFVFYLKDKDAEGKDYNDRQVQSSSKYRQIGNEIKDILLKKFNKVSVRWFAASGDPYVQVQVKSSVQDENLDPDRIGGGMHVEKKPLSSSESSTRNY
jgi:hypothetical protein